MSAQWLQRVRISVTAEAEDAVTALLARVFQQPASVHHDLVRHVRWSQVFLRAGDAVARVHLPRIRAGLQELRSFGIDVGEGKLLIKLIRHEDWAHSWKRHFKPLEFGDALLVKPSWSRRRPRRGQAVVILDPGLSFGTGQHATT